MHDVLYMALCFAACIIPLMFVVGLIGWLAGDE